MKTFKRITKGFLIWLLIFVIAVALSPLADLTIVGPDYVGGEKTEISTITFDEQTLLGGSDSVHLTGVDCNGKFVPINNTDCPAYGFVENGEIQLGVKPDPALPFKSRVRGETDVAAPAYNNAFVLFDNHGKPFLVPTDRWLVAESLVTISYGYDASLGIWFNPYSAFSQTGHIIYENGLTGMGYGYVGSGSFEGSTAHYYSVGSNPLEKAYNLLLVMTKQKFFDDTAALPGIRRVAIKRAGYNYVLCVSIVNSAGTQTKCEYAPMFENDEVVIQFWSDDIAYPNLVDANQYVRYGTLNVYTIK